MTPAAGILACTLLWAQATAPFDVVLDELVLEAERLEELLETDAARALLEAVGHLPPAEPATVYRSTAGGYLAAAYTREEYEALDESARAGLSPMEVDTRTWYHTFYGSPLASLRALDVAAAQGIETFEGKRVLDFGFGSVGQLRLLATCGADVVGTEVMPLLRAIYAAPGAQGSVEGIASSDGRVTLAFGRWPADENVLAAVGTGFDLFVSKNTLKRGFLNPPVEIEPGRRIDLGVEHDVFLQHLHDALRPGGLALFYNLGGRPAGEGEAYRPHTDIASPWERARYEGHGFEVLALDVDDSKKARRFGAALEWGASMKLEDDLFARYTLLRRRE